MAIFGSREKAATFGTNAAKLVQMVNELTGNVAHIGVDLDIEGATTSLPEFGAFVTAFRGAAAFDEHSDEVLEWLTDTFLWNKLSRAEQP